MSSIPGNLACSRNKGTKMTTVFLFNGPPGSGKDHSARIVRAFCVTSGFTCSGNESASAEVKRATHMIYGLPEDPDYFEGRKDVPQPELGGITPREAYIHQSERVIKPLYGKDYYGKKLIERLQSPAYAELDVILLPGIGFIEEAVEIVNYFGADNCFLIRIRRNFCSQSHLVTKRGAVESFVF